MGIGGRNALHRVGAVIAGQLVGGHSPGKAHPYRSIPRGNALQYAFRERQIAGILRQSEQYGQGFPAAGGAGGGITLRQSGRSVRKRNRKLCRQHQQVQGVLFRVQVGQQKTGLLVRNAQQHRELIGDPGQLHRNAALTLCGLPQPGVQIRPAQQHGAAYQRQQHQQRRPQRCPERIPTLASMHGPSLPFGESMGQI